MKKITLFTLVVLGSLFLTNCKTSTESSIPEQVYPNYLDENSNNINDFVEPGTHEAGVESTSKQINVLSVPGARPGHSFTDEDNDGICDFAQDGSSTWHGPGFIDNNNNGICDYWDVSHPMHTRHGGMQFHDEDGNHVNDYFEEGTHRAPNHDFRDEDNDGLCDFAQDGSPTWHGPGFVDSNHNGMSDHWENGGRGHGGMMGGGHH